jgi:hypothetical protein
MDKAYERKELYHSKVYPYSFNKNIKYKGMELIIRCNLSFIFEYHLVPRSEIVSKVDITSFHIKDIIEFSIWKSYKGKFGKEEHCFYSYFNRPEGEKEDDRLFNLGLHEDDANFLKQITARDFIKDMMKHKDDSLSSIQEYINREVEHRKDEIKSEWAYDHSPGDIRI